jgi:hypothetical protein
MATIQLPVIPASAYNENRLANTLLLAQVRELEKAVREAGRRVQRAKPRTEAEVAAYIRHLNRALFHQKLLPVLKRKPLKGNVIVAAVRRKEAHARTRLPVSRKKKPRRGSKKGRRR